MKQKLEPVDKNYCSPEEARLRLQWEKDLASYKKPAPSKTRNATLLHSANTNCSLGYILFVRGVCNSIVSAAACELLFDDPDFERHATLACRPVGFNVFYKDNHAFWYACPYHFKTLADVIPYLQGGNRVLIEYR